MCIFFASVGVGYILNIIVVFHGVHNLVNSHFVSIFFYVISNLHCIYIYKTNIEVDCHNIDPIYDIAVI